MPGFSPDNLHAQHGGYDRSGPSTEYNGAGVERLYFPGFFLLGEISM